MIVIDASFALHLLLSGDRDPDAAAELGGETEFSAPTLIDFEVLSALRRKRLREGMSESRAQLAIAQFYAMPIERVAARKLAQSIWALRQNASAYDASYLALAEVLRVPLLTLDRRLREIPGSRAKVIVLQGAAR